MTQLARDAFLHMDFPLQKQADLRQVFDPQMTGAGMLKARCIRPEQHSDGLDSTPSLAIWADHVRCFGCGSFWWPDQFLLELGTRRLETSPSVGVGQHRLPGKIPLSLAKTYNRWLNTVFKSQRQWLYARGLRQDILDANLIGHDGAAYTIPIFDRTDPEKPVLANLRFRRDDELVQLLDPELPRPSKYFGLPGRNKVRLYSPVGTSRPKVERVHLCEGELDALRLAQEGYPAISFTNGCRAFESSDLTALEDLPVYVMYDQDTAGKTAGERLARTIGGTHVQWPYYLGKDVTEYLTNWSLDSLEDFIVHA